MRGPLEGVCPNGHVLKNLNLIGWGEPLACFTCRGPLTLREQKPKGALSAPRGPKRSRHRQKAKGPIAMICPYDHIMEHYGLWGCRRCLIEAICGLAPRVKRKEYRDMRERGVPMRKKTQTGGWRDPVYPAYKCKTAVRLQRIAPRWLRETIYVSSAR